MSGSTVVTTLSTLVIGTPAYPDPVTITSTGGVVATGTAVTEAASTYGVLVNYGTISSATGRDIYFESGGSVVNYGLITSPSGYAIDFGVFANVTNMAGGVIFSEVGAIKTTDYGIIDNAGTIIAQFGEAVDFSVGGSLVNTGLIEGEVFLGGDSQVINESTIYGEVAFHLASNGSAIHNAAGALIRGYIGVALYFGEMLANAGTVIGTGSYAAVDLVSAGDVTNAASGVISGEQIAIRALQRGVVVFNEGTISGGEYAIAMANGSTLIDTVGAVFIGTVSGGNTLGGPFSSTIELAVATAVGTLAGLGSQFVNFADIELDGGGTWSLSGTVAAGETILFGAGAELELDTPQAFGGTLVYFTHGDTLDLTGATYAPGGTVTALGNSLEQITVGTQTFDIQFDPTLAYASGFRLSPDGGTGVDVMVACFLAGTQIATADGSRPVEALCLGDVVRTASGALRPVKWIGHRSYEGRFIAGRRDIMPVVIRAGALADGVPSADLQVSPKHAMFVDGALVPAELLVNGASIVQRRDIATLAYFHVELDTHDILLANGAPSESFVDRDSRMMFHNAAAFFARFPDAASVADCAPRLEHGSALEDIRRRIAGRAGLAADHADDAARLGPLDGRIDTIDPHGLTGWLFDATRPHTPVRYEVVANGAVVAVGLANVHRSDLAAAGLGNGRCAILCGFTRPLSPGRAHTVTLRRVEDGAAIHAELRAGPVRRPAAAAARGTVRPRSGAQSARR